MYSADWLCSERCKPTPTSLLVAVLRHNTRHTHTPSRSVTEDQSKTHSYALPTITPRPNYSPIQQSVAMVT